ncbi:MAG: hypothetical protein DSY89_01805 [Deltaproteobacteria bacterium]|nr:MAG: hypothetical protein DSY89_01805 [Deltaproteobacteria bacterium]
MRLTCHFATIREIMKNRHLRILIIGAGIGCLSWYHGDSCLFWLRYRADIGGLGFCPWRLDCKDDIRRYHKIDRRNGKPDTGGYARRKISGYRIDRKWNEPSGYPEFTDPACGAH